MLKKNEGEIFENSENFENSLFQNVGKQEQQKKDQYSDLRDITTSWHNGAETNIETN